VYEPEWQTARRKKAITQREEVVDQREALMVELKSKLETKDKILEHQRVQQEEVVETLLKGEIGSIISYNRFWC
jgi:hypothetical protein